MQRARGTNAKICIKEINLEPNDSIPNILNLSNIKTYDNNTAHKKVIMMSPRTRERRRGKLTDTEDGTSSYTHSNQALELCHGNEYETHGNICRNNQLRASTLIGLKRIKSMTSKDNNKQVKKCIQTPTCQFCIEYEFCAPHIEYIFMDSIVDDLIAFTQPMFQVRIPLPNHSWRETYPLELKENAMPESIVFNSGKMKIIYPLIYYNQKTLYTCDNCLETLADYYSFMRHHNKCTDRLIGVLVYEDKMDRITIHRINGEIDKNYCRRLCMLAKLFLEHKTLFYDVEPFLFYVLHYRNKFVGYFSKEKISKYNLSCIVVLPVFQGKGFGTFMIDVSYCLSIGNRETGTPEKPLSKQGLASYQAYWKYVVYYKVLGMKNQVSIMEIANATGLSENDVVYSLEMLDFIKKNNNEYYLQVEERSFKAIRRCKRECFKR